MSQTNTFNELQSRISNLPDDIIILLRDFGVHKRECFIFIGKINIHKYEHLNKHINKYMINLFISKTT